LDSIFLKYIFLKKKFSKIGQCWTPSKKWAKSDGSVSETDTVN